MTALLCTGAWVALSWGAALVVARAIRRVNDRDGEP